MRRFHVSVTFEGYVEAQSNSDAVVELKTKLGLPPASMRPEVHMTGMSVREVGEDVVSAGSTLVGTDVEDEADSGRARPE